MTTKTAGALPTTPKEVMVSSQQQNDLKRSSETSKILIDFIKCSQMKVNCVDV
ncbi:MAG: hypothetical protein LJE88_10775 [Deltaproteobacteria bacterium]|nr:hypothetical protein [Deltaproteobacteria bacterium]